MKMSEFVWTGFFVVSRTQEVFFYKGEESNDVDYVFTLSFSFIVTHFIF